MGSNTASQSAASPPTGPKIRLAQTESSSARPSANTMVGARASSRCASLVPPVDAFAVDGQAAQRVEGQDRHALALGRTPGPSVRNRRP